MEIKIELNDEQIRRLKTSETFLNGYQDESIVPISIIIAALVLEEIKNPPPEYIDRLCDIRDCEDESVVYNKTLKKKLCVYHHEHFKKT